MVAANLAERCCHVPILPTEPSGSVPPTSFSTPWLFVCPGKCWRSVSGGAVDGDAEHKGYRYGGMWKNKHAGVSAKMPKKAKERQRQRKTKTAKHDERAPAEENNAKREAVAEPAEEEEPSIT